MRTLLALGAVVLAHVSLPAQDEPAALEIKGYVVPARTVIASAGVSGRVVELMIEPGARVKKGELLAKLDSRSFEVESRLAQAGAKLAEAKLSAAVEGGNKNSVAVSRAEYEMARAKLELAELRLDQTAIRSPIDGTVLSVKTEIGNTISPGEGLTVCELADLQKLMIEIEIPTKDLKRVRVGQPGRIRLDDRPDTSYRGTVSRISPVVDRAKDTVTVWVRFDASDDPLLRPGTAAVVALSPVD